MFGFTLDSIGPLNATFVCRHGPLDGTISQWT
jgi:hypothetical protein